MAPEDSKRAPKHQFQTGAQVLWSPREGPEGNSLWAKRCWLAIVETLMKYWSPGWHTWRFATSQRPYCTPASPIRNPSIWCERIILYFLQHRTPVPPELQQCWQTTSPSLRQHFQSRGQLQPQDLPLAHQSLTKHVGIWRQRAWSENQDLCNKKLYQTSRAKVLPEDRVVEVASTVELKSSMQPAKKFW